jgi:hypothetical protein
MSALLNTTPSALRLTLDLARRIDRAEIDFCALAGAVGTAAGVASLEVGGGRALFGRPGSPLNKVLGLGLSGPVSDEALKAIERFYRERASPAQIELCPLAYADVPSRLCARGFVLQAFETQLARSMGSVAIERPDMRVMLATPGQDDLWARVVAEGFAAAELHAGGGPEHETFTLEQMMEMMSQFQHPEIRRYLAWVDGKPAGGGSSWIHDGVLGIAGTATLPRFRRRGVQTAIALQAMEDAAGEADIATATTAPGSTSQRTFERAGFQVLYNRTILIKA